jgi:hypothetical protein
VLAIDSRIGTVVGALFAAAAVVGTQFLGWEWGDGRLVPALLGVIAVGVTLLLLYRQYVERGASSLFE